MNILNKKKKHIVKENEKKKELIGSSCNYRLLRYMD